MWLGQLKKVSGSAADQSNTESLQVRVQRICEELERDTAGLAIENLELLRFVVEAKFAEDRFPITVFTQKPPCGGTVVRLASAVLGKYPEAAFNLEVIQFAGVVQVFLYLVPKDVNFRDKAE